ncbi:hypothetical protein [Paenibacillus sp.]|uniref:hypothetical protein n=1 Tax=Paenibacillus sp. TaxID=58172 RepID=UPI002D5DB86D|nr:hypothetical protein [Paenibacillus sp.]HZG56309.1 hypothetical protein [Paenibacillus sp.]
MAPKPGHRYNVEAFTLLKPAPSVVNDQLYRKFPQIYEIQYIGANKLQEVLDGKKEARQALKEWQTEGDAAIERMLQEQANAAAAEE